MSNVHYYVKILNDKTTHLGYHLDNEEKIKYLREIKQLLGVFLLILFIICMYLYIIYSFCFFPP